jgi:ubiquinone/menaquinone biosynthesis C-methylase UbiE
MEFKNNFVRHYIKEAPLALALERSYECNILSQQKFEHPILDIGCGDGVFAAVLFGEKIDVGIDYDAGELDRARNRGGYQELICCEAQQIPGKNGTFKTIFANSVLEHIVPIRDVLKEARRLLADDGRIYLTLPTDMFDQYTIINQLLVKLNMNSQAEGFRKFFNNFWKHYHYYNIESWKKLFEECGLIVTQSREYNPKGSCLLNDLLVPLCFPSFLSRKFLKRWFLVPGLRRFYAPFLSYYFEKRIFSQLSQNKDGGLVFFELKKHL